MFWLLYLKFRKRWTFRFSFLVDCTWLHQRECFCCLLIALLVVEVMRETRYCVSATPVRCMPAAAVALCIYTFFVVSSKDNRSVVELLFLLCFSSSTVQECGDNTSLSTAHSSCCHCCLRTGVCSLCGGWFAHYIALNIASFFLQCEALLSSAHPRTGVCSLCLLE